jgi:DNA-binding NarL/FixJ family response regulator
MICNTHNAILLIAPSNSNDVIKASPATDPWLAVRAGTVGEALRLVRLHRPRVLVMDVSMLSYGCSESDTALRVIHEVRRRLSRLSIIVLGASEDSSMEQAARSRGATIYLPINEDDGHNEARRFIKALHARDGPKKTRGSPTSGVPPRET